MAVVDLVDIVELAVMLRLSVIVMRCCMSVEIAHAEMGTATGLDGRCVDRPFVGGCGTVPGDHSR